DKPNLNFAFNYELRNGFMPEMDKIKGNWNASLSFSYPIFDGFKTKYAVEEGISNLKIIDSKKSDFEKNVESEIEQVLSDLKSIENKITYEKEKIKHSEISLNIAEERYKNGLISATELIESQNNYSSAKLNYLQLIYNHIITKYNLYKTIGKPLY
ncbi:MAG TPA: TolC family protein, partial [Bacteroidota bacterium]|nr:TolC family protein [Bacteroidota bacterium]